MYDQEALTFDDVLLIPSESEILPNDVCLKAKLTQNIDLNIPLLSSAMDTVTEHRLAIAVAQAGGIGIVHKNLSSQEQSVEVEKVKRYEAGMVVDPITIQPDAKVKDAIKLMRRNHISGIPVVDQKTKKLLGIITNRDIRFLSDSDMPVSDLMTKKLVTVNESIDRAEAKAILHKHRIEKLLVTDNQGKCTGLITVKDIENVEKYPNSCRDYEGRLRVGAAIGIGLDGLSRAGQLVDAGVDVLVVDTAHGHSKNVVEMVRQVKKNFSVDVIAGNIATSQAAEALINAGADAVKVGIGPGSICTTRIIAGVGMPQLTALKNVITHCQKKYPQTTVIADGGIKTSGDIAKAIAAGANTVMIGSLLAGTEESPGDVYFYRGRAYKTYRGMGSLGAMARGSADRYFQDQVMSSSHFIPEGIEGQVPYKGPVAAVIHQLMGGLKASMGYTGCKDIEAMRQNCSFVKITSSGLRENHVHDVEITRESPNYVK